MLVELGVVEQRYRAVLEVLDEGVPVTAVSRRYGVARQTVHEWLRRYGGKGGLGALADRLSKPVSCPHQMPAAVEARVVARATARPVCQALTAALARHGVPDQILTDNGKVFTGRFGLGPGPVMSGPDLR